MRGKKVKQLPELIEIRAGASEQGNRVVFTNGCFDLIHPGHIYLLNRARELGDILFVGANSDRSVRMLKGEGRPIVPLGERLAVLSSLEMVDYLVVFEAITASSLIRRLRPDIYVKGGDYSPETLPEWPVVQDYGGRIELIPVQKGFSTSRMIERIKGLET